jgi:hypothetical protein
MNYRGSWDVDHKVGAVQLALSGGPAVTLPDLDAANFAAVLAMLKSDANIQYDTLQKRLFSPD